MKKEELLIVNLKNPQHFFVGGLVFFVILFLNGFKAFKTNM